MNYEQAEIDILTLIGTRVDFTPDTGAVLGIPMPEKQADYYKAGQKPVIFVGYMGCEYGENEGMGSIGQMEHAHFEIIIKWKNTRGTNGIYQLETLVQQALVGMKITDFEQMTCLIKRFVDYRENEWHYQMVFKAMAMVVIDSNGEDVPGNLQTLTIKSTFNPNWTQPDLVIPDPSDAEIVTPSPNQDLENNATFTETNND